MLIVTNPSRTGGTVDPMNSYGLLLDLPKADDPAQVLGHISTATGLHAVSDGGNILVLDHGDLHSAISRVEQAGGHVVGVRELPADDDPNGPRRRHAETFTALVRARAAMRRTPDLRLLWSRYEP
jgi:hypothetical protein